MSIFASIGSLIADLIAGSILNAMMSLENRNADYIFYFRLIYPKWLSFKQKNYYRIYKRKTFRHIQQERKRLSFGVIVRN